MASQFVLLGKVAIPLPVEDVFAFDADYRNDVKSQLERR